MEIPIHAPLEPMDAHMLLLQSAHAPIALNLVPSHSNHSECGDVCLETMPQCPEVLRNPNTRSNLDAALIAPQEVPLTTPLLVADLCGYWGAHHNRSFALKS